jgi:hypothetical protein
VTPVPRGTAEQRRPGLFGTPVMTALGSAFNLLALNLVLLLAALPLITLPAAVNAATIALDQWRGAGEDRVVREFLLALRASHPVRSTVRTGVPIAAAVLGVVEARYFLRSGSLMARTELGLGLAALLITLAAAGYVFLLGARHPGLPATELWSLSARLAVRNLMVTGPLFLAEIAGATALILADPPLLLAGVPVVLLQLMRLTAQLGLRRAGLDRE